jgi:enamine deaminase RidA (YjgF/YER057c/UK114 family)
LPPERPPASQTFACLDSGLQAHPNLPPVKGTLMATHTVRKVSQDGIGYSIVELNDVRHVFAAAVPRCDGSLRQQADDALQTIAAVIGEHGTRGSIVHQAVFVRDPNQIEACRRIIREFYGHEMPATSYIPQPPCDGKLLSIEALGVGQGQGEVEIERISEQLVIARHNRIAWVHASHAVPQVSSASVYEQSLSAFRELRGLFDSAGVRFTQIIRTWLYLGGIVDDDGPSQRYKELNRARTDFYRDMSFLTDRLPAGYQGSVYPASTGIGTEGRGISMSAIALVTDRDDIVALPLENPRQTAAYAYGSHYSPKSPKFSRAMVLSCGEYTTIFVSGTASITASETRHIGNAAAQTEETLDNIAALIGEDNLTEHGLPGLGTALESLGLVRVYIKRPEDYAQTRAVCERRLGELPTIYAIGDVCRPELLVEIEGIAFSRKVRALTHSSSADSTPQFEGNLVGV